MPDTGPFLTRYRIPVSDAERARMAAGNVITDAAIAELRAAFPTSRREGRCRADYERDRRFDAAE